MNAIHFNMWLLRQRIVYAQGHQYSPLSVLKLMTLQFSSDIHLQENWLPVLQGNITWLHFICFLPQSWTVRLCWLIFNCINSHLSPGLYNLQQYIPTSDHILVSYKLRSLGCTSRIWYLHASTFGLLLGYFILYCPPGSNSLQKWSVLICHLFT